MTLIVNGSTFILFTKLKGNGKCVTLKKNRCGLLAISGIFTKFDSPPPPLQPTQSVFILFIKFDNTY